MKKRERGECSKGKWEKREQEPDAPSSPDLLPVKEMDVLGARMEIPACPES